MQAAGVVSWAGERYDGVAIPRVGMEVLVDFLEGDPDSPLVSGCLYHAVNVPPYELPTHKTRSVFKIDLTGSDYCQNYWIAIEFVVKL